MGKPCIPWDNITSVDFVEKNESAGRLIIIENPIERVGQSKKSKYE